MKHRQSIVSVATLAIAGTLASAPAHAFLTEREEDGIYFIEAVGIVPTVETLVDEKDDLEEDDFPEIPDLLQDEFNLDDEPIDLRNRSHFDELGLGDCFGDWQFPTLSFSFQQGNPVWGSAGSTSGDVDRVEIRGRSASDFGFLRDETLRYEIEVDNPDFDEDEDPPDEEFISEVVEIDCADLDTQWNEYEEPDGGRIFIFDSLTVEAGAVGTEVRMQGDFELVFFPGSAFTVRGTESRPVTFRGSNWNGIELGADVTADLEHCIFRQAGDNGALRVGDGASLNVRHCEFRGNEGGFGGAIRAETGASLDIAHARFEQNEANQGGGIYARDRDGGATSITLTDIHMAGHEALRGAGLYLEGVTNAQIRNLTVLDSEAGLGGGVMIEGGSAIVWNPVLAGNTARLAGGGLLLRGGGGQSNLTLHNPTIAFNDAERGGGVAIADTPNTNPDFNQLDMRNAIVHGNALRDTPDARGPQIDAEGNGSVQLQRVMLDGGLAEGYDGPLAPTTTDVIFGDPAFRDTPDEAGEGGGIAQADLRLASASDAINRGDYGLFDISGFDNVDRDGDPRQFGQEDPEIDLGAYEFQNNPPTLRSTADIEIDTDERSSPTALEICGDFTDLDQFPDPDVSAEQFPWLTVAPADGFGDVLQSEGGREGDVIIEGSAIEDSRGRVFFDPERRSSSYEVTIECRIRDEITRLDEDGEPEVDEDLSMFSRAAQTVHIQVSARNDSPAFEGALDTDGETGRSYESELRISDPDADHEGYDLRVELEAGPAWLELDRISEDEVRLSGSPDAPGDYDVRLVVIDPAGGTTVEETTVTVEDPDDFDELDAGPDVSAEPGEDVRLSAEGPDSTGLLYEWRILDSDDDEVASQTGRDYTWTAEEGVFTAIIEVSDGVDVLGEDSLSIAVAAGLTGNPDDPADGEREAPDEDQEAELDGMSEDGDADNIEDWEERSDVDKASALASLAGTDLTEEQQDQVLAEAGDLLEQAAADDEPIDPQLAELLATTYANLSGLELDDERRERALDGTQTLRATAAEDGVVSAELSANLIRAGSGMMRAGEDLPPDQRDRLLDGVSEDLASARDEDIPLDDATTNRGLAALDNSLAANDLDSDQADQILEGVADAIAGNADPSEVQLTRAAQVTANLMNDPAARDPDRRAAARELGEDLASVAIANGESFRATGGRYFKSSATRADGGAAGDIPVGEPGGAGPSVTISEAVRDELRTRNALADDADLGFAVIATLSSDDASYVVEIIALDADGERLTDVAMEETVRVTIPITRSDRTRPTNVDGTPVTMSNTNVGSRGVAFDADEFAAFSLTSEVEPSSESSGSDRSSCFLDSLF